MTITELSIKRPILVIVLFTALAILGVFSYMQLKYEVFPDIDIPIVTITTQYPGASASVVEAAVTKKIEDAVSAIDRIDYVASTSMENVSIVTINFLSGTNIDLSLQDVQRKVNQILADLPDDVKPPAVAKISLEEMAFMFVGVTGNLPPAQLYQTLKDQIQPQLTKVPGIGQISLLGGQEREIRVNIDPQKARSYGLSNLQILQALQNSNVEYPTGKFKDVDNQYVVRLAGKFTSIEQIKLLPIGRSEDGGDILLTDVAEVYDGIVDPTMYARVNGKDVVGMAVQKQTDANAVEVAKGVRKAMQRLEEQYKDINLKFQVAVDNTKYTMESAKAVKEDLLIAILLVAAVMLIFLHSIRNAVIVMLAIPTSLVTTFIGMKIFDLSLNNITLLSLSLVIGILVDDAIVVLENIYRHLEMGKDKRVAALEGRNEIGFTALSITMVDIVVFGPLALAGGTIGGILRSFAMVIVVSTLMSLFVSFTVTPLLASRFSKLEKLTRGTLMGAFGLWFEGAFKRFTAGYIRILRWGLEHPIKVLLLAGLMLVAALSLVPGGFIGMEFMPQSDQGTISVNLEMPQGTKLEETDQIVQRAERIITRLPGVEMVFAATGISDKQQEDSRKAVLYVSMVEKKDRVRSTAQTAEDIKVQLAKIPGLVYHVGLAGVGGSSSATAVQFVVTGTSWNDVVESAERIKQIVAKIPGTNDVRTSAEVGQPELKVNLNRQKMSALGLNIASVGQTLQVALTGNDDSKYRDVDGTEYPIRVMIDQFDRTRTDDVGNLTVMNNAGQLIELRQFAEITQTLGATSLERRDRNYAITVSSQAIGRTSGDIGADVMKALAHEKFPRGVNYAPTGTLKNQADSFAQLLLALIAGVIFMYLIMVALYNSFIYPFPVLFAIPMAFIGALLALALSRNSLAIFSIMGLIMQMGLVSKNAILLVDFTNKAREDGRSVKEALVEAGRERIRPILMTTSTMILGMLPLALSSGVGSEMKNGLGWVLIGGLTCSMIMTLVVVPVVYMETEKVRQLIIRLFGKVFKKKQPAMAEGK